MCDMFRGGFRVKKTPLLWADAPLKMFGQVRVIANQIANEFNYFGVTIGNCSDL